MLVKSEETEESTILWDFKRNIFAEEDHDNPFGELGKDEFSTAQVQTA